MPACCWSSKVAGTARAAPSATVEGVLCRRSRCRRICHARAIQGENVHHPQLAVELVTKGLPCLRLFSDNDKEEVKVYEMFADAFFVMQVRLHMQRKLFICHQHRYLMPHCKACVACSLLAWLPQCTDCSYLVRGRSFGHDHKAEPEAV